MTPETSMTNTTSPQRAAILTAMRILMVFDSVALLFAAVLHVNGAQIPLGSAVFVEPRIVAAAIAEGLAGLIFVVGAYAVFTRQAWAWPASIIAHAFAIAAFIVGIITTRNGTSPFNYAYHRVMLVIFVGGLILLLLPIVRQALRRGG